VTPDEGEWEDWLLKIASEARTEIATADTPGAKQAVLRYRVQERQPGRTLLEIEPRTGPQPSDSRAGGVARLAGVRRRPVWSDVSFWPASGTAARSGHCATRAQSHVSASDSLRAGDGHGTAAGLLAAIACSRLRPVGGGRQTIPARDSCSTQRSIWAAGIVRDRTCSGSGTPCRACGNSMAIVEAQISRSSLARAVRDRCGSSAVSPPSAATSPAVAGPPSTPCRAGEVVDTSRNCRGDSPIDSDESRGFLLI